MLISLSLFFYPMCVHAHMCVCVCLCIQHVCRSQKSMLVSSQIASPPCNLRQALPLSLKLTGKLVNWQAPVVSPVSASPAPGLPIPAFYTAAGDPSSDLHSHTENTSLTHTQTHTPTHTHARTPSQPSYLHSWVLRIWKCLTDVKQYNWHTQLVSSCTYVPRDLLISSEAINPP